MSTKMQVNELSCVLHMPDAIKSNFVEGKEVAMGLPPYAPQEVHCVDEYDCSVNWMHGSGLASSYFVGVKAGKGLWLDFNENSYLKHHVAILISIQGVNPLDGQSMVEEALHLCQYKHKCKIHDIDFGGDRHCEKCGYKWVPQNYLCTTGTPSGSLWLDGFLAADGVVRQYYFTEDEVKGVAHNIIGKEKKVYSIGIAFYLSKNPKPEPVQNNYNRFNSYYGSNCELNDTLVGQPHYMVASGSTKLRLCSANSNSKVRTRGALSKSIDSLELTAMDMCAAASGEVEESVKTLDIAAGAKINQKVYADPESLDFWCDKPAGMLYINYTPSEEVLKILKKGKRDLTKNGEGFLAGLSVGK